MKGAAPRGLTHNPHLVTIWMDSAMFGPARIDHLASCCVRGRQFRNLLPQSDVGAVL